MQFGCVVLRVEDELMSAMSSLNQSVDWRSADEGIQVVLLSKKISLQLLQFANYNVQKAKKPNVCFHYKN